MNKTISLIAIVTGLVLTSCGSLQTISFEQLQAADVSFPDAVRNVAVVNNMPAYKVGDSHDVISMELKGDGKTAAGAGGHLKSGEYDVYRGADAKLEKFPVH